jgi:ribonuclease III
MFSYFNEANIEITRKDIINITGVSPVNVIYYQKAFIHKSVLRFLANQEEESLRMSYERYEFLGDSVLNLVIASFVFHKYPDKDEGFLTRIRTKLVNGKTLAYLSRKINLNKFLIISKNVEAIGGRNNDRFLEDIFEALICAINLDLGFKYAEQFILNAINKYIDFNELEEDTNYKDILLRRCQQTLQTNPEYELVETSGPPHRKIFTSVVLIKGVKYSIGTSKTKKESEQIASKLTLEYLEKN